MNEEIKKKLAESYARKEEADKYMREYGAHEVSSGIDSATLEINILLKNLFLCSIGDIPNEDFFQDKLMQQINDIVKIVDSRFGKNKSLT